MNQIEKIQNGWTEESKAPALMKNLFSIINSREENVFDRIVATVTNQNKVLSKDDMGHIADEFYRCNTWGNDSERTRELELEIYHANKVEINQ